MITYIPAFDLYHTIFRMAHIAAKLDDGECFEIDKVRIWDFYLLFPAKTYDIMVYPRKEKDAFKARERWIEPSDNHYDFNGDSRKFFEWIKPFQVSALNCLVSCGILKKEEYLNNRVCVEDRSKLKAFITQAGELSAEEHNALSFLGYFSRVMPLTGIDGLKARTQLLESKYDAE